MGFNPRITLHINGFVFLRARCGGVCGAVAPVCGTPPRAHHHPAGPRYCPADVQRLSLSTSGWNGEA